MEVEQSIGSNNSLKLDWKSCNKQHSRIVPLGTSEPWVVLAFGSNRILSNATSPHTNIGVPCQEPWTSELNSSENAKCMPLGIAPSLHDRPVLRREIITRGSAVGQHALDARHGSREWVSDGIFARNILSYVTPVRQWISDMLQLPEGGGRVRQVQRARGQWRPEWVSLRCLEWQKIAN